MENKWKVAGQQSSGVSGDISFAEETPAVNFSAEDALAEVQAAVTKNPVLHAETAKRSSIGSRWTHQKKMGVTMGAIGLGLFMIGLAPFFIDSAAPNGLKGNLTQDSATATSTDPLAAMFQNASVPETVETVQNADSSGSGLSNFGEDVAGVSASTTPVSSATNAVAETVSASGGGLASFEKSTYEALRDQQSSSAEVDRLLAGNTTFTPTPVVENTNVGKIDTQGNAFGGPDEPLHASAGLQNTSVSATKEVKETPKSGMSENIALGLALMFGGLYWSRRRRNG